LEGAGRCSVLGERTSMKMRTPLSWGPKMTITPAMKARKDIVADLKVFGLRVNSGEMNGLNINLKACELVEMQIRISLNSSSKPMENAWRLPNWITKTLVDGCGSVPA